MQIHCLDPIIDSNSSILILGSMPGKESLRQKMYYANRNNHFWDIIFRILDSKWNTFELAEFSTIYKVRCNLLLENGIALWDVIESCERTNSSDKSIRNPVINDFESFFQIHDKIKTVIFNGQPPSKHFFSKYNHSSFGQLDFFELNSTNSQNPNNTFRILSEWNKLFNSFRVIKSC